jgi:hypothetical protein
MHGKGAGQKRVFRSQALKLLSDLGGGRGAEQGFKRGLGVVLRRAGGRARRQPHFPVDTNEMIS